jgi:hypothetical protein
MRRDDRVKARALLLLLLGALAAVSCGGSDEDASPQTGTSTAGATVAQEVWTLVVDNGASPAACAEPDALRDPSEPEFCLEDVEVLATKDDIATATAAQTRDGWFVRATFTPAVTKRLQDLKAKRVLGTQFVRGDYAGYTDLTLPLLIGDGSFDERAARSLAAQLNP